MYMSNILLSASLVFKIEWSDTVVCEKRNADSPNPFLRYNFRVSWVTVTFFREPPNQHQCNKQDKVYFKNKSQT